MGDLLRLWEEEEHVSALDLVNHKNKHIKFTPSVFFFIFFFERGGVLGTEQWPQT